MAFNPVLCRHNVFLFYVFAQCVPFYVERLSSYANYMQYFDPVPFEYTYITFIKSFYLQVLLLSSLCLSYYAIWFCADKIYARIQTW